MQIKSSADFTTAEWNRVYSLTQNLSKMFCDNPAESRDGTHYAQYILYLLQVLTPETDAETTALDASRAKLQALIDAAQEG